MFAIIFDKIKKCKKYFEKKLNFFLFLISVLWHDLSSIIFQYGASFFISSCIRRFCTVSPFLTSQFWLSQDTLLSRCLGGKTQNANESLLSLIWKKFPKHKYAGKKRISVGCAVAISMFSQGMQHTFASISETSGTRVSAPAMSWSAKKDKLRVEVSDRRVGKKDERRRKKIQEIQSEEARRRKEGSTYGPGAF